MLQCDITYDIENVEEFLDEAHIIKFCNFILKKEYGENYENNDYYLSLLITNNDIIQEINREYRQKNMPTDVISFAYNETENIGPLNVVGDIVISMERVTEQAKEYEHGVVREFYYVLCHGMLHLMGYDHINEKDKKIMREKEEEILSAFNYKRENIF